MNDLSGGDLAPALAGPGFVARWGTRSLGELVDYMRSVMPLNSPGGLSAQQNADLLAFMLRRANYPPGAKELPASTKRWTRSRLQRGRSHARRSSGRLPGVADGLRS